MEDLYGRYEITEDGRTVCSGNLEDLKLEAQASKVITLPDIPATKVPGAEYFINFSFCQKRDTEWAKADYEVATEQFKLSSSEKPIFVPEKGNINLNETADALVVKGERFEAVFSKKEGTLSAYTLNNVPLMSKGLELNLFRAPTDNDKQVSGDWQRKGLYQLQTETGKWETRQEEDRITLHIRNCHKGKLGFEYRTEMEYTVNADGSIMVNSVIMPVSDGEIIPRVGYRMELPEGFERMRWYGRGPWENYTDRKDATPIGVYESTVSDQWVDYVKLRRWQPRRGALDFHHQRRRYGLRVRGRRPNGGFRPACQSARHGRPRPSAKTDSQIRHPDAQGDSSLPRCPQPSPGQRKLRPWPDEEIRTASSSRSIRLHHDASGKKLHAKRAYQESACTDACLHARNGRARQQRLSANEYRNSGSHHLLQP